MKCPSCGKKGMPGWKCVHCGAVIPQKGDYYGKN